MTDKYMGHISKEKSKKNMKIIVTPHLINNAN